MLKAPGAKPTACGGGNANLGDVSGVDNTVLSEANLAAHTHSITDPGHQHDLSLNFGRSCGVSGPLGPITFEYLQGIVPCEALIFANTGYAGITGTTSQGSSEPICNIPAVTHVHFIIRAK